MGGAVGTKYCGSSHTREKVLKKIQKFFHKTKKKLAIDTFTLYTDECCDMIAMKREVATFVVGFPWSECQVRKLTTSHCTNQYGLQMK